MAIAELVKQAAQGGAAAQKSLFGMLAGRLFLLCRRYVKDREKAEEILQDGFVKIFRALPRFSYTGEGAFLAWVKKIMVNECLMELRRKNSFVLVAEEEGMEHPVEAAALEKLTAAEIFQLVLQLPAGYRTVFNLCLLEGYSHREVAEALQITEGTSKSQLSKARNLLQKMLEQNEPEYAKRKSK